MKCLAPTAGYRQCQKDNARENIERQIQSPAARSGTLAYPARKRFAQQGGVLSRAKGVFNGDAAVRSS